MKRLKIYFIALVAVSLASCMKNDNLTTYTGTELEWDAATYNANSVGVTYPLLTRVPGYGRAVVTSDATLTRTSGTVKFRVNLVGAQRSAPLTISYIVLPVSTAILGTHYNTTGTFTIPANSSFGEVSVDILNPGATTTGAKTLVLELVPQDGIIVNANDKDLGLSIAQN